MEGRALARLFNMPDPRCADPRFDRADVSYLSEEMLEWGLDPTVIDEEAFLKARDRFIQGRIELEDVPRLARKFQDEFDARDLAIALSLLPREEATRRSDARTRSHPLGSDLLIRRS